MILVISGALIALIIAALVIACLCCMGKEPETTTVTTIAKPVNPEPEVIVLERLVIAAVRYE